MIKYVAVIATVVVIALALPGRPVVSSGNWKVRPNHSDVQLSTDGTTNFGKDKTNFTIGFARAGGIVKIDTATPANSEFHVDFYPANSMEPALDHDGKISSTWLANHADNTMICFHSDKVEQTSDGKLKASGTMGVIRVDRNVSADANEAYSGPVYGPPIFHHLSRPVTFVFDAPAMASNGLNKGSMETTGTSSLAREDFPQFFTTVLAVQWPPVIRDKNCQSSAASESYAGATCTGTFLAPSFPVGPQAAASESYPGPQQYNTIVGQRMTLTAHLSLKQAGGKQAAGGN